MTHTTDAAHNQGVAVRHDWTLEEVRGLYELPLLDLVHEAQTVHRQTWPEGGVQLCQLLSVKTGGCSEDCGYCPQAARYHTGVDATPLLPVEEVLAEAKAARDAGASRFCMGAAWRQVKNGKSFDQVLDMVRGVKDLGMEACCTLGMLNAEQAQRLATLANQQFDRYRLLFAGEPRISRDPDTLVAMVGSLKEILGTMRALQTRGVANDAHLKNMQIVSDRLENWEQEIATIRDIIARAPKSERVGRLGEAANKVFAEYREHFAGKDRKTRDLTKLANLIEALWPIQRCMDAIDADDGDDANARNLSIVTDQLRVYDREYRNIQQAQEA